MGSICLFFFFFFSGKNISSNSYILNTQPRDCCQFLTCVTWIHPHHQPMKEELCCLHLTEKGSETQQGELLTQPLGRGVGPRI